jgi:hypothetical protein
MHDARHRTRALADPSALFPTAAVGYAFHLRDVEVAVTNCPTGPMYIVSAGRASSSLSLRFLGFDPSEVDR